MMDIHLSKRDCIKIKRYGMKMTKKLAFCHFITDEVEQCTDGWQCCGQSFKTLPQLHVHIGQHHKEAIDKLANRLTELADSKEENAETKSTFPLSFSPEDNFPWLPICKEEWLDKGPYRVLLFYHYRDIDCTDHVSPWQTTLCERLHLTGKVRVSSEGINVTVCGREQTTKLYMDAVRQHPLFMDMSMEDFKQSDSEENAFDCLKVGVFQEAVPMGVDPQDVSYKNTGQHLSPEEFHAAVEKYLSDPNEQSKTLLIDCRNFYESKIGKFRGALDPNLRKFSYWPEYVEKNKEMFMNKKVLMYCTGGIRCERGSAFLRDKGICNDVYQLNGGIHKYIEKFPDGHFRGKLFVFDDRYSIQSNEDVLSVCVYCGGAWDRYSKCSSGHCHQLVLTCGACAGAGRTACCERCGEHARRGETRQQCTCTAQRQRVPVGGEGRSGDMGREGSSGDTRIEGGKGELDE